MPNKYFTSVFTQENLSIIPSFTLGASVPLLETVTITPHIVYKNLAHINTSKSSGADDWPLLALREKAKQIRAPLSLLFTKSLESGILPQDWKSAQVTPTYIQERRLPSTKQLPFNKFSFPHY